MNWLILRGLVREQRHWRNFKTLLGERTQSKVFALDLPGMGTEIERDSPITIRNIMLDLRERFEKIKNENPGEWGVCTVSLGSMVALQWISEYPNEFKRVVITNTSCKPLNSTFQRFRLKNILKIPSLIAAKNKKERERIILEMTTSLSGTELDQIAEEYARFAPEIERFRKTGVAHLIAGSAFVIPQNLKNSNGKVAQFLVLTSANDTLVDTACSDSIAKFLNAPIQRCESANHDLALDNPEWFVNSITDWL